MCRYFSDSVLVRSNSLSIWFLTQDPTGFGSSAEFAKVAEHPVLRNLTRDWALLSPTIRKWETSTTGWAIFTDSTPSTKFASSTISAFKISPSWSWLSKAAWTISSHLASSACLLANPKLATYLSTGSRNLVWYLMRYFLWVSSKETCRASSHSEVLIWMLTLRVLFSSGIK